MSAVYTERAGAEQYLAEIEVDARLLLGQLACCTGKGPRIAGTPIYFDALRDAHSQVKRALEWAYKASGYPTTDSTRSNNG